MLWWCWFVCYVAVICYQIMQWLYDTSTVKVFGQVNLMAARVLSLIHIGTDMRIMMRSWQHYHGWMMFYQHFNTLLMWAALYFVTIGWYRLYSRPKPPRARPKAKRRQAQPITKFGLAWGVPVNQS